MNEKGKSVSLENEKQYYRVNGGGWYMTQVNEKKYEMLSAYRHNQKIEHEPGICIAFETDYGCTLEPISEASYNRVRRWVLNKIMSHV